MKRLVTSGLVTGMLLAGTGLAGAASIQFPYVSSNPGNVSTLISVINLGDASDICGPGDTLSLHYLYVTKSVTAAHTDACDELNFYRPTTPFDIVTFDLAGNIGNGLAMFNDATSYNSGVGAPNFDIPTLGTSDPRRGYVLVTHRCMNGTDKPLAEQLLLDGEAMLFDVVNGAAWNYPAAQSIYDSVTAPYTGPYGFAALRNVGTGAFANGSSADILSENYDWSDAMPLMPPGEINTRMLVTPQVIASNNNVTNNMSLVSDTQQKRTRIQFLGRNGVVGMTNRNEGVVSGGGPVHVRCVAGIDVSEILGLAVSTIYNEGGWVMVDLTDPSPLSGVDSFIDEDYDHAAFVTKLEFGAPAWSAGNMINAARSIRTLRVLYPPEETD